MGEGDHIVLFTLFNGKICLKIPFAIKMMCEYRLNFSSKCLKYQKVYSGYYKTLRVIFRSLLSVYIDPEF